MAIFSHTSAPAASLAALCREYALDALYVFGSRAQQVASALWDDRPLASSDSDSDVDIGALPRAGAHLDARDRATLTMALEPVFGNSRIDLVLLPEAPPFLALDIVSGELLAVLDRDRVAEYELFVLRRAGDLAPFERERRSLLLGRGQA